MPGSMNGRQLADEARRLRPTLKILFTSGYTENTVIHYGRLDAGVRLLAKPHRRADLARMIRSALDAEVTLHPPTPDRVVKRAAKHSRTATCPPSAAFRLLAARFHLAKSLSPALAHGLLTAFHRKRIVRHVAGDHRPRSDIGAAADLHRRDLQL